MRRAITCLLLIVLLLTTSGYSQPCTNIGQTPSTAFPVCGNSIFTQTNVPLCGSFDIPVPCTIPAPYQDRNPFWYKFTCFTAGTLGFLITPMNLNDDYDWQVFDITGQNPNNVFTDPSLFVACNWAETPGITGASPLGTSLIECAGIAPNMSIMPLLIQGHDYLLLVSHFTNTQSGYQLEFTGGTAVITDPLIPAIQSASANCDGTIITVHFNKKMKCNSLAGNGTDFTLSPSGTIISASGFGCTNGFDFDSLVLTVSAPLPPGNYTLTASTGSDGNTLQDHCDTEIVPGNNTSFTILAGAPLMMGTVGGTLTCAPASVTLNFTDSILCNSIAADGSDFIITGPSSVTVSSASFTCTNGMTTSITIQFTTPISVSGNYQLSITTGTDGNTLLGSCNRRINPGASATFTVPNSPPVLPDAISPVGCSPVTIRMGLNGMIQCSSIAADGSDFAITGPSTVTVLSANGICASGITDTIIIQLSSPITRGGNYQVQVVTGSDGNTLLSPCSRQTPTGTTAAFVANDTVSAAFTYTVSPGCSPNDVQFSNGGGNGINNWNWTVNGNQGGNLSSSTHSLSGSNLVALSVSNGVCNDTETMTIDLGNNNILVDFIIMDTICPEEPAVFINSTTGTVDTWLWDFGNGQTSSQQTPAPQQYPVTGSSLFYTITLTATNAGGCRASRSKTIQALSTCIIAVPSGFTPNNDGLNDELFPLNGFKASTLEFKIFDRWGQLIFETRDWRKKWNGKLNGIPQATGVYVWMLNYTDRNTSRQYSLKGTTLLIR